MAVPTTPDIVTIDTATITPTGRQKWLPAVYLTVVLVIQLPQLLRHSADPSMNRLDASSRHFWLVTFAPLYAIAMLFVLLPLARVEVGETALTVRRPLRRRRVLHWREIQCILVDERGSRRRVAVYGDDPDGRRVVLPVPFTDRFGKDPRFAEKFHLLGQAWIARRGEDWVQLPPAHPHWLTAEDAAPSDRRP